LLGGVNGVERAIKSAIAVGGHEKQNQHTQKNYFLTIGWNVLEKADIERVKTLATGYSCRPQVDRFKKIKLRHPIQVLLNELF